MSTPFPETESPKETQSNQETSTTEDPATVQEHMDKIEKRTGVNPKVIVGGLAIALLLSITRWFSSYVTCLVGTLFPTYLSLKAIESPEEDDDKLFLTYWVVYGLFSIIDLFLGFLVKAFPIYYTIKLAFLIWLFMPNTKGAIKIYALIIKPLFLKYESKLDKGVSKIIKQGQNVTEQIKKEAGEVLEENSSTIIKGATKLTRKIKSEEEKLMGETPNI